MIKSYFKIAWRNLVKQKGLSFISLFGLSVGIACFSLCALYAIHEFSFDDFHKNATDIYRVYRTGDEFENNKDITGSIFTPMPLGPAMKRDLPGVENYVRYLQPYEVFIKTGDEGKRGNISFTDTIYTQPAPGIFFAISRLRSSYSYLKQSSLTISESRIQSVLMDAVALGEMTKRNWPKSS